MALVGLPETPETRGVGGSPLPFYIRPELAESSLYWRVHVTLIGASGNFFYIYIKLTEGLMKFFSIFDLETWIKGDGFSPRPSLRPRHTSHIYIRFTSWLNFYFVFQFPWDYYFLLFLLFFVISSLFLNKFAYSERHLLLFAAPLHFFVVVYGLTPRQTATLPHVLAQNWAKPDMRAHSLRCVHHENGENWEFFIFHLKMIQLWENFTNKFT